MLRDQRPHRVRRLRAKLQPVLHALLVDLNDGRLGTTRILKDGSVREMFRNHTGSVTVQTQATNAGALSRPFPLGAGEDVWGLGFQLSRPKARKPDTRSPGSGTWAGIFNTHFWVDREEEVGVIVMMQLLPFVDGKAMELFAAFERGVYASLDARAAA